MVVSARRLVFLITVCLCAGAFAGAAKAGDTQGDRYRDQGGSDTGTRAYIAGSGTLRSDGDLIASVSTQNNFNSSSGLFQVGEIYEGDLYAGDCGTGILGVFVEYKKSGSSTYVCPKTSGISQFGNGGLFDAVYGHNGWEAFWNSNVFYNSTPDLLYANGWSIVKCEAHTVVGQPQPSYAMTWGPNGQTPWQYEDSGSNGYQTINHSLVSENDDLDNDGDNDWHLGGSPSPFNMNWSGF